MSDWPVWLNFLVWLILPCAIVFGLLFWALYGKDKK